jgi:quercetin dioxygenase-like cupin family protein
MVMPTARSTTSADTDSVRITTWTFEDGEDTGHHRHEYDYVVVPVTGGTFAITEPDGTTHQLTQEAAVAYLGRAGTEHNVISRSHRPAVFVEVEIKR